VKVHAPQSLSEATGVQVRSIGTTADLELLQSRLLDWRVGADAPYRPHELDCFADQLLTLVDEDLAPSTEATIANTIDLVVQTLQCETPSVESLDIYFELLMLYPKQVVNDGILALLKVHKWRNLPTPGNFIEVLDASPRYKKLLRDRQKLTLMIFSRNELEIQEHTRQLHNALMTTKNEKGDLSPGIAALQHQLDALPHSHLSARRRIASIIKDYVQPTESP